MKIPTIADFFTSHDLEAQIQRSKVAQDNASPSGYGSAAQALLRLALLSGNSSYTVAAERFLVLYLPDALNKPLSEYALFTANYKA